MLLSSSTVLIFIFVFTLLHYIIKSYRRPPKFPPGPPYIPILGSIPFLKGKGIEIFVDEYIMSFGDIVGTFVGTYPFVLINDWKTAKELFTKEISTGRLENYTTAYARSSLGQNMGLITTDGRLWGTERSFALKQLKNFGLTKKHLDSCILPQAKESVQYLEGLSREKGHVRMDGTIFSVPVLNVIWQMITGVSLEREDKETQKFLSDLNILFARKTFIIASLFPWFRFIFPTLTGYNERLDVLRMGKDNVRKIIHEHKATLNKQFPRDLIDAYLIEKEESFEDNPVASEEQLTMVCFDLMAAGAETTSTTLLWIIEYMILYPDVQEKCYAEISELIGAADVTLADAEKLTFCLATVAEVQRLSAVAVSPIQHRLTQETEVNGYILPQDCLVISNIKHFMTDPNLWDEPKQFNPSRFINASGAKITILQAELSVFFVTLIQNLKFECVEGRSPSLDDYTAGFTRIPLPYYVNITRR